MHPRRPIDMQHQTLLLAFLLLAGQAAAGGCHTDANGIQSCDGLSWSARVWIYVGAAVILMICTGVALGLYRRHLLKKRSRLPAAKGARAYRRGEYLAQRQEYLPGYDPTRPNLPVRIQDSTLPPPPMVQVAPRPIHVAAALRSPPAARVSSRSDNQPPPNYHESTASKLLDSAAPAPSLRHANSDATLTDSRSAAARASESIARTGPAIALSGAGVNNNALTNNLPK